MFVLKVEAEAYSIWWRGKTAAFEGRWIEPGRGERSKEWIGYKTRKRR